MAKKLTAKSLSYLTSLYNEDEAVEYLRSECGFSDEDATAIVANVLAAVTSVLATVRRP